MLDRKGNPVLNWLWTVAIITLVLFILGWCSFMVTSSTNPIIDPLPRSGGTKDAGRVHWGEMGAE